MFIKWIGGRRCFQEKPAGNVFAQYFELRLRLRVNNKEFQTRMNKMNSRIGFRMLEFHKIECNKYTCKTDFILYWGVNYIGSGNKVKG